eukprot:s416_g14.t1
MEDSGEVEAIEESVAMSSLRWCHICKSQSYLGLCTNLLCPIYYMRVSDAPMRITAKGRLDKGEKRSPDQWSRQMQNRVECDALGREVKNTIQEYRDDLDMEVAAQPVQPKAAMPMVAEPVVVEDLESGGALYGAANKRRSKGVKRPLPLHAKIEEKKAGGEWEGPAEPLPGLSDEQKQWIDNKVKRAIASAPWRLSCYQLELVL